MAYETYSERKRRLAQSGQADVYTYDISPKLRNQIALIWIKSLGDGRHDSSYRRYLAMENVIKEAEGLLELGPTLISDIGPGSPRNCHSWLQLCSTDQALDIIEVSAVLMEDKYVDEMNFRMKQNAFGYQIEDGTIIRVDDEFVHAEIVKPAIALLTSAKAYETAASEFLKAHEHHRHNNNKDAVVAANRAFESTLKAICHLRNWPFEKGARASDLIKTVHQRGLFPDYLDKSLQTYIAMMKSGLPEVRNNAGGHGASPSDAEVPSYIAAYAIHLSALNIIIAIEAERALET